MTRRPPRQPVGAAELVVLGVYPSALHVRWTLPSGVIVGALAVDDEPEVFWNGAGADDLISRWKADVGWSDSWGRVGRTAGNGSSGRSVENHVLEPLGVKADRVLFTDCLPTFFVKSGKELATGADRQRLRPVRHRRGSRTG